MKIHPLRVEFQSATGEYSDKPRGPPLAKFELISKQGDLS